MELIKKLPRLFWLNILWLIGCILIVTAGASTCAAFAVALRLADDDEEVQSFGGITRRFFKAFRQDLLQGFFIEIFTIITAGLGCYFVYLAHDSGFSLIKVAAIVGYFILVMVFNIYSYPLIARYSNSFVNTLRNSVALFLQYANASVKTMAIVAVEIAVLALTYKVYFAGIVILPSVVFYTISRTAKNIFFNLENPQPVEE